MPFNRGAIKYLFTYVGKGHNRFAIHLNASKEQAYDEFQNYQDCRYISALEAVYRMLEYDIIDAKPTVECLEVHLPDRQQVYFLEGQEREAVHRQRSEIKFPMWFAANRKFPNARHLSYDQFPCFFRWVRPRKKWMPRQSVRIKKIPRHCYAQEV